MKRILRKAGAGLMTLLLSAAYAQAGQDAGGKQKEQKAQKDFDELLARVKKSDAAVDFGHLRSLVTELDSYGPLSPDTKEMLAAFRQGDYKAALKRVDEILAAYYLDVDAHYVGMIAADK